MQCAVAIQVLPMDAVSDDEVVRIVSLFVGPFESAVEGDYDLCMDILKACQEIAVKAGAGKVMTYAKIDVRAEEPMLTTERKVGKYAGINARFDADHA